MVTLHYLDEGLLSLKFGLVSNTGQRCLESKKKPQRKQLTNVKTTKSVTLRLILARKGSIFLFQTFVVTFSRLLEGLLTPKNDVEFVLKGFGKNTTRN